MLWIINHRTGLIAQVPRSQETAFEYRKTINGETRVYLKLDWKIAK